MEGEIGKEIFLSLIKKSTMKKTISTAIILLFILALSQVYGQDLRNKSTAFGKIESNGDIRINGSVKGRFESNGDIRIGGSVKGKIESNGDIRKGGSVIGRVESNGDVRINGSVKGRIESNGDIRKNGSVIGSAKGVSARQAAVIYFFDFLEGLPIE